MPLDIARVAQAALSRSESLLPEWLPGGHWEGAEWRCGDLGGGAGKSFAANRNTGKWSDFASGESGGDLVSLYAAINGVKNGVAARTLAKDLALDIGERAPLRLVEPPKEPRTEWEPIVPVPADAGAPPRAHVVRGAPDQRWDYYGADGTLLGCVYRFRTSDGGKEVLPCTYCAHPRGAREWRWVSFRDPRPLYVPARVADPHGNLRDGKPVLVVEGEKCADAAYAQLGQWFDVVSWPGGGKAAHKAAWSEIAGRRAVLWPDCDAKTAPKSAQLLPAERQPGIVAMRKIAGILAPLGGELRMVDIPAPGSRPDGWDVADAIAEGLTGEALREWIVERLVPVDGAARDSAPELVPPPPDGPPPAPPPSGGGSDGGNWQDHLIYGPRNRLVDCRENVMMVLVHHPRWAGQIGYNAFAGRTESLSPTPWGTGPGEWTTRDDRELGLWLAHSLELLIRSEANLSAGVEMAAERATFHPVLRYIEGTTWDGTDRLSYWLHECCGVEDTEYTRLAGALFVRAMVARVWKPGAQVDHMLVLEGVQGRGKSTALRVLGGEWYSDTQFRLGDKDALLQLVDVWLYEVSELDSFSRADVTAVKQFLTTLNDNIRGVYERRARKRPRQVVMAGTTNQQHYLRDMTGNRRFWPVKVGEHVDVARLREWRDQLFAQAYAEIKDGARWWPTREEERIHFVPAQEARTITDPWLDELPKRLAETKWFDRKSFTTAELLGALGVSADKIDNAGQMAKRVETIMDKLAWSRTRERRPDGTRPHVYVRPDRTGPQDSSDTPIEVPL